MNAFISLLQILLHPGGTIIKQLVSKCHLPQDLYKPILILGELRQIQI